MEIKINKEIRAYRETLFFGLSVRQFVCSVLAVGAAVALYFSLNRVLDRETVSWVCIVGAAPVAAAGILSVQRPHAGAVFMGVAEIRGHHGRQACLESGKLL